MSNSYHSQSWSRNQGTYNHQGLQLEHELDFSAVASTSDDMSQQSAFSELYHTGQYLPSGNNTLPASITQTTFPPTQSQPIPFGHHANAQNKTDSSTLLPGAYASNQGKQINSESFGSMYNNQVTSEQHLGYNYNFQAPISNGTTFAGSGYSIPDSNLGITTAHLSSSPTPIQDSFPQLSNDTPHQSYYSISGASNSSKRHHSQIQEESRDEDHDPEMGADAKEAAKAKPGACARCKNLKVKCEFKTETDPCKRCLNGGHDCIIPGRKKRRTPPKREHLLNQIREQAAQIKELMSQLEATHQPSSLRRPPSITSESFASSLNSPVLSPSSTTSFLGSETPSSNHDVDPAANKAVEEWIAKAKQSFQEFDGFIGIGGAGMPKSYLVEEDLENPESDDDDYVNIDGSEEENDDYEFAVEHHDGDTVLRSKNGLRHKLSSSSLGTNGTGATRATRKKNSGEASKPAILPGEAVPFGLFGKMALTTPRNRGSGSEVEEDDKASGIANTNFFRPSPAPETRSLAHIENQTPHILTRRIVTPQEAEQLFQIYFERMNLSVSLLDPVLYTAQRTCYRSPFLFTVICAIASRFYSTRPELYQHLMHYAQLAAGTALISGSKNVEMCQAYILLSLYPVPAKRWEDQRSWLYLGLAIRTATDLNLHLPNTAKPLNENHAREMLNRTRVWLNCYNLDRSTGSQYGKPPIISNSDFMANHSEDWWKSSPQNMKNFDIQICAYNADLRVLAGAIAKIYSNPHHPTGLNKEVDFEKIATEADDELQQLGAKWFALLDQTDMNDPQNCFRTGLLRLAYPYARLVILSYGFQHAFGKGHTDENPFLLRCMNAASDTVHAVLDDICRPEQLTYWRHGPEAQSVFVTFASAFLVKLLQPKFSSYVTREKRIEIRELVQRVIDLLSSPEIAIDDRHGPKLYSKFLKGLLAAPMARTDSSSVGSRRLPRSKRSEQTPEPPSGTGSTTYDHPSPALSNSSLSPAPRQAALSFDSFAPIGVGATDPFGPELLGVSNSMNLSGVDDGAGVGVISDFFQPPLPFDEDILQSMQSFSDPSGWQDTTLPAGFNWATQFQQNIGLDFKAQYASMFADESQYMTGVQQ